MRQVADQARLRFAVLSAVVSSAAFLVVFDGIVVTVALPSVQRAFGLTAVDGQWVVTAYMLGLGGLLLVGGRVGDRYGRRRTLVVGLLAFAAAMVLAGIAATAAVLLVARAAQGVAAALIVPNANALISGIPRAGRRRLAFAVLSVASSGASVGAAVGGGAVVQWLGWRYVFLLTVPIAVGAAVAARWLPPGGTGHRSPRHLDLAAAVLCTIGLVLLVYAITTTERGGWSIPTLLTLAAAIGFLAAFAVRERRARAPLVPAGLLRIPALRLALLARPGQAVAYNCAVFVGMLFFQEVLGYRPFQAGLAVVPLAVAVAAGGLAAGLVLRWLPAGAVVVGGLAGCSAALVLLALARVDGSYPVDFLPGLLVLGLGVAVVSVTLNETAGADVSADQKGIGYGLFETVTHVSAALAVAVLATVAAAVTRVSDLGDPAALAAGYRTAFAVGAAISLLIAALVALRLRVRHQPGRA